MNDGYSLQFPYLCHMTWLFRHNLSSITEHIKNRYPRRWLIDEPFLIGTERDKLPQFNPLRQYNLRVKHTERSTVSRESGATRMERNKSREPRATTTWFRDNSCKTHWVVTRICHSVCTNLLVLYRT